MVEVPREMEAAKGMVMFFIVAMFTVDIVLSALAGVSCFLDWKQCWLFLLFAYAFSLIIRVVDVVNSVRFESGGIAIAFNTVCVLVTLICIAYLHSDEVKKYYKTEDTKWTWLVAADAAGCCLAGILAIGYLLSGA